MKQNTKRIWIYLLLGAMLFSLLTACNRKSEEQTEDATESETTEVPEVDTNTDPEYLELKALLRGNVSEYQIVRAESMKSAETKMVLSFRQSVNSASSSEISVVTDFEAAYPRRDKEIVIGKTSLEGSCYTLPDASKKLDAGTYAIDVIDSRVILSYADENGLKEGMEFLLIAMVKGDKVELKNIFSEKLLANGIVRYTDFTMNNFFTDEMTLSAASDLLCFGTAAKGRKISVGAYQDQTLLRTVETVTDADGNWKLTLPPETSANTLRFFADDVCVQKYEKIAYKDRTFKTPSGGMRIYINGVEQKALITKAGTQVIYTAPSADVTSLEISIRYSHRSVKVYPTNEGLDVTTNNQEVKFTVDSFPKKLSVEFNGSYNTQAVQLFLYPYDDTDVTKLGSNVIYVAPGEYTQLTKMRLTDNQILYLDREAILHTWIEAANANNVTIMGYGVIDTYPFTAEDHMLTFEKCKNLTLKNFTLVGPRKWMVKLVNSADCTVSAMNIMGTEMNSDGVDIVGCKRVTVENCYLRNNDDCIAIKSFDGKASDGADFDGVVETIRIIGNVFFNDKYGNAMEIGYETRTNSISDVLFEDNDVIHILGGAVFSIHLGDRANVSNITYRNNRVEDCYSKLIDFFINETQYTKDDVRGTISNVTFENIAVTASSFGRVLLSGYSENHQISGVTFTNMTHNGVEIAAEDVQLEIGSNVSNVTWNGVTLK